MVEERRYCCTKNRVIVLSTQFVLALLVDSIHLSLALALHCIALALFHAKNETRCLMKDFDPRGVSLFVPVRNRSSTKSESEPKHNR